jgi:hypothetical protein
MPHRRCVRLIAVFAACHFTVVHFAAVPARAASLAELPLVGGWFTPPQQELRMTEAELASLGCLTFGVGGVALTALLGGAAAVATGGAAPASVVAMPILAGVAAAGCAFGSAAAPGLAWLGRNRDALAAQVGEALPPLPVLRTPEPPVKR